MRQAVFNALFLSFMFFYTQNCFSKTFGGLDATYLDDDSFSTAQDESEVIQVSSAYLGYYKAIKGKPAAWIMKANYQAVRFDTFDILDHQIFSLGGGLYYQFDRKKSLMLNLDVLSKQFDLEQLDGEVYKIKATLKHKIIPELNVKESLALEYGDSVSDSNTYTGLSVNGTATWTPFRNTALSTGLSWNKKVYEVEVADERTNQQLTVSISQSFKKHFYARLGGTRKRNENNENSSIFYNTLFSASLGIKF